MSHRDWFNRARDAGNEAIDDALDEASGNETSRSCRKDGRGEGNCSELYHRGQADTNGQADSKRTILITEAEDDVNNQAVAALASDTTLFQRVGMLVRLLIDEPAAAGGIRWSTGPRIEPLPRELLRERMAAAANWVEERGDSIVSMRPPGWCIGAVHVRGQYGSIRPLYAVLDHPVLRKDGTILTAPGYDAGTGLYLVSDKIMSLPDRPTLSDAQVAAAKLLEIVQDFPFASEAHKSAWLVALLTPPARFAYEGPAPLILVDSNVRGSGKGLLLDCISTITTGKRFCIATYTDDQDELRNALHRWLSRANAWCCLTTSKDGSAIRCSMRP